VTSDDQILIYFARTLGQAWAPTLETHQNCQVTPYTLVQWFSLGITAASMFWVKEFQDNKHYYF
jgi:hypothetical protein